jgi:putative methyltransferase (TIGR04325 family)
MFVKLWQRIRAARPASRPEWEYVPAGWSAAQHNAAIKGWNDTSVLETYKAKWPTFVDAVQGCGPLSASPESPTSRDNDVAAHNATMVYAYALALAAHRLERISMLDWGGGIGHYLLIGQALLRGVAIDYSCKDVPLLVEHGRKLFPEARFVSDESWRDRKYDFILASGSLQYWEDWQAALGGLAACLRGYLLVTRLPIVHGTASFVVVQRPYAYGYDTEYLGWCLNRQEVLKCAAAAGLEVVREFRLGYRPFVHGAPEQNEYWAFLFRGLSGPTQSPV